MPLPDALEFYLQNPNYADTTILTQSPEKLGLSRGGAVLVLQAKKLATMTSPTEAPTAEEIASYSPCLWLDHTTMGRTANTTVLTKWGDRSGNGYHTATAASPPSITNTSAGFNGKPALAFSAGTKRNITAQSLKDVFVVCKPTVANSFAPVLSLPANYYLAAVGVGPSSQKPSIAGPTVGGAVYGNAGNWGVTQPRIVTLRLSDVGALENFPAPANLVSFGADGHETLGHSALGGSAVVFSPDTIGEYGGTSFAGDIACILAFSKPLSHTDRGRVMRYLSATYGVTLPTCRRLIGLGDSIMAGQGLSTANNLIGQLCGSDFGPSILDGTQWCGFNAGVGTTQTRDILCQGFGALDNIYALAQNVVPIIIGTNNNGNTTVDQALTDLAEICTEIKRRGAAPFLIAMLPNQSGNESFRTPYNIGQQNLVARGLADFYWDGDAKAPSVYALSAPSGAMYQDGLHPSAAGVTVMANAMKDDILNVASKIVIN